MSRSVKSAVSKSITRITSIHKVAVGNLVHMPLFCTGTAAIDFAAFHINHGWGWLATGVSLIVAEFVAADE